LLKNIHGLRVMAGFRDDPLFKVVEDGIKRDIDVALEHERYRAAVILIYAGIDSMAYLGLPEGQTEVKGEDFIRWADRYIRLPSYQQLSGEELYGARCGMLHTSGIESKRSRAGRCRVVGYTYRGVPGAVYDRNVHPNFVLVSVEALKAAFFAGVNEFLIAAFASPERRPRVEARMDTMVQIFPIAPG
jgi:hypothetical protein